MSAWRDVPPTAIGTAAARLVAASRGTGLAPDAAALALLSAAATALLDTFPDRDLDEAIRLAITTARAARAGLHPETPS